MKRVVIALLVGAVGLAACSERNVEHKAAGYQGKTDTRPWDSPEAGGAKAQWEQQIETRTLNENEYRRMK